MVLLIVLTLFSLLSTSCSASLVTDFHVLVTLKKGFEFPEPLLSSWNSSNLSSVCSWAGIGCSRGRVVSLDLTDMNMCGSVSPQISRLDRLANLSLAGNNFTGSIEIANLSDLRFLNISNNQFNGHLDWNYASIANLEVFDAYDNNFTALLPVGILGLKKLRYLDLGGNYFYGKIPPSYGTLVGLEYLSLAGNDLNGKIPGELGNLINLREIYLGYYNVFEGGIPIEFGNLANLVHMDLSSCELDGPIPQELGNLKLLETLYLHINLLSGPIPKQLGNLTSLVYLDLSHNALTGEIPPEFVNLKQLRLFNLFMNRLHGSIPDYLADLPNLEILGLWMNNFTGVIPENLGRNGKLQSLDLSSNKLTGTIPRDLCASNQLNKLVLMKNFLFGTIPEDLGKCYSLTRVRLGQNYLNGSIPNGFIYLQELSLAELQNNYLSGTLAENGNPQLCGSLLNNPCNFTAITSTPRKAPGDFKLIFALGLLICSLIFATAAIIKAKSFKKSGADSWKMTAFQKLEFTISDILECVKDGNVIGRGGAGIVYHGKMPNGMEIAVKKLLGFGTSSHDHGFRAEIQTLGNIRHRNIVRLLAFCSNKETNLLVYEYMRNGSLGEALHGKKGAFLVWNLRYKIAIEAAKGLCYLHHDCSPLIVHRDVKSNNILLNSSFEAHVADFGLAKFLVDGGASECMSAIAGSYGYIAPEYAYTLRVDEKSDVYSFGVVILELITGRRPVGDFGEGVDIVHWTKRVTNCRREEVIRIADPRLTTVPKDEAMHLLFIAMLCVQENSIERPTMREVVQMLLEFPRHSPEYQSSSSSLPHYQRKNLANEKNYPKK
ncbi:leucine-rich repeat receptor-like serine/threonine-protein kinase BAM2 isoform X2 [Herrania umbratica]|uniref:non-specific serine/threonine protein kinase n=1 Tax=Herrania umbratica TaxID=108875 RepID=A0A6J1AJX8_9ROSI|nr:leucine-rich repeat receptor-like serine/threonine-protein kinase BAM2 isoform X2 [Herrania umbratica]